VSANAAGIRRMRRQVRACRAIQALQPPAPFVLPAETPQRHVMLKMVVPPACCATPFAKNGVREDRVGRGGEGRGGEGVWGRGGWCKSCRQAAGGMAGMPLPVCRCGSCPARQAVFAKAACQVGNSSCPAHAAQRELKPNRSRQTSVSPPSSFRTSRNRPRAKRRRPPPRVEGAGDGRETAGRPAPANRAAQQREGRSVASHAPRPVQAAPRMTAQVRSAQFVKTRPTVAQRRREWKRQVPPPVMKQSDHAPQVPPARTRPNQPQRCQPVRMVHQFSMRPA